MATLEVAERHWESCIHWEQHKATIGEGLNSSGWRQGMVGLMNLPRIPRRVEIRALGKEQVRLDEKCWSSKDRTTWLNRGPSESGGAVLPPAAKLH